MVADKRFPLVCNYVLFHESSIAHLSEESTKFQQYCLVPTGINSHTVCSASFRLQFYENWRLSFHLGISICTVNSQIFMSGMFKYVRFNSLPSSPLRHF